jgi:hypothetical protein
MTTLWVEALTLEFSYNRIRIPDTEPGLTVDQGRPGFRDRDCLDDRSGRCRIEVELRLLAAIGMKGTATRSCPRTKPFFRA